MKLRLLKLTSLLLVLIFLQHNSFGAAPTIDLSVTVNSMSMLNGGWGTNCGNNDCGGVLNEPDPRIEFRVKNSSSGTWLPQTTTNDANWGGTNCGSWFGGITLTPVGGIPQTRTAVPMNDLLNVQMSGRELDDFLSGGDDGVCGMQNIHSGINNVAITSVQPCMFSDLQESRISCSSDGSTENYGTRWAWKWFWNGPSLTAEHAGQIAFNNSGNPTFIKLCTPGTVSFANIVSPIDPVPHTVGIWENIYWQRQMEGSGGILLPDQWQTLGFVGLTPTDNNLGLGRWHYRRVARFCTGDNGVLDFKEVFSNEIIVEVVPQPVAPVGNKLPNINTVCVGQTITLQNVGYGTPEDAVTNCGIEYQYSVDNGDNWSPISNTLPSIQAVGNVDPTKSINIIRARVKGNCNYGSCNPSPWMERSWTVDYVTSPSVSGNRDVCKGQSTTLTVTNVIPGATVKWYLDAALTNEVLPRTQSKSFVVNNNMSIWVLQSRDATGCPSLPTKVDLTVKETTASLPSSTPVVCLGNSISPSITHTTTGATGIGVATGLPNGVAAFFSGNTITISGVPTQTGTFTYNIPLIGDCPNAKATGIITVVTSNTAGVPSAKPTLCIGTLLPNITHTTLGATGIGTPVGLPTGVTASWSPNTIVISGTPTVSGVFNYTIPLTGGCSGGSASGTITVTPNANAGTVTAGTTPQCIGQTTTYTAVGAELGGGSGAWSSSSPSVASVNPTTGVVTALSGGTTNIVYTITGGCGGTKSAQAPYTVSPDNTVSAASSSPSICVNSLMPSITHTTTGATGIGVAINLPSGVSASFSGNTITISGTPTAQGTFNYSIPLTGGCGSVSATGTISVTNSNTVSPASSSPNVCINQAITSVTHTTTGATGIGLATGIPAGLSVVWNNNVITISGTPTTSGTFNYSIPLIGGCGSVSATGTITVITTPVTPTVSVTAPTCTDAGFAQVTNYDGTLNYTLSSNNISIDGSGKITGAAGNYTVTVGNGSCSATSASFSIASKLVVPAVPTVNVIAATCSTAGSAQVSNYNSSLVYTVSPNTANIDGSGKITGAAGPYTVTADNGSCTSTSATFTIAGQLTTPATPTVSVTAPTCTDAGFAQVTNYDGTLNYTLSSNNISIDGSGKITGAAGNYTVTVGNGSCSATSASFSIASKLVVPSVPTVNVIAATCSTAGSAQVSNYNSSLVYTVSPNTANIDGSGKITGVAGPYTVTADNGSCTSTSAIFTIAGQLTTPATPTVSVTAPTCTDAGFAQVTNYDGTLNYTLSSNNISIDGSGKITGAAGNYTVTVGNGSCSATSASFSIASKLVVPAVPTVNVIAATCSTAGSAQVSNYNSSLVYTVSPNTANIDGSGKITGVAGPYTVTADNGSCTSTSATFTIDALISSAPTPVLSADNTTICAGNSALLSSDVTTVKWYRDAAKTNVLGTGTPISTGNLSATTTFYAENTSGACIGALASITINVVAAPSAPTATKLPNKSSVCIGTTLTIQNPQYGTNSGNSCPFEYQSSTDAGQTWSAVSSTVPSLIADGTENIIRIRVSACNGCTASNWTDYSWTVISDTARPAITGNLSVCTGTSTTLVANAPIGSTVRWYSDNGLTTLVNTGTSFSPIITSNTSFFVTQTQDLCTSAATQVDVVALPAPAAPTLTLGHSPICGGQNTDLYSSSSTVVWYLDAAKSNRIGVGSTINTGTIYTTMTYYAADTSGLLCPSPLSSITVDVIPAPDLGNIVDVSICSGTSALLTGGSSATEWYSDDAMTNNINMGATYQTPILTATTNYYLRVPSSCGVTLDTVTVTVKPIPAAPTANDVEVCSGLSASIALANVSPGATVQWYNAPSLDNMIHVGSVLITPILTSDAVYYVTQTVDGCTSPSSSFNVYVKPSSNAPTLTANPNVICFGDASALSSSSTATIWYSDAGQTVIGNGQTISVSPLLTTTYYAQDTAVGCSALASVTVKVDSILPAPNIQDVTVCQGADAVLTGGNSGTAWYAADQTTLIGTGATIIVTNVQSASLYYARNEGSSCVSAFDDVTIHITTTPPPTAADAEVCSGQSASLSATGQNIVWYSDAGLTNAVQSGSVLITPALTSDVTYYVTNESNGCESEATAVQVTVTTPAPAPVITANPTSVCSGGTTELSSSAGANTVWYSDAGMTVVGSGSPFTSAPLLATTTFYARDNSVPNCPGELASVQVLISASETAPNVSNTSVCEGSSATLTGGTANTHWYSDASLTTEVNVGTNYTTPVLSTATTYYLRNENGLCVSPVTEVTVSVNPIPAAPTADVVEPICGSGSASLSAQGDANAIITWYADGAMTNALHIGSSYITPILTANTSYYVTQELNGCESAVTEVEVEINELPTIDPVDPQQVCSGSTAIFEADNPNGYDIEWYSDPAGLDLWQIGDEFETPVLTQYTAWYYRAVDPITGCEGEIQSTWADVVSNKDITITATSKPTCVDEDIVVNVASYDFSGLVGIFDYDGNIVAVEDINGTTGGTQVILPGLPVAGVYSYYVVEAGDIFCATSSSTFTVEVVDRPVIDNVVGDEICIGEVAQITATATPANAIITWYSDATLANAVGTGNTLTIPGLTVNTTYYAVASNGLCASDPMDVEVIVNPIPATPELSSNSPVCEGSELTLSTTTAGNVTYIWSGPAGFLSGDQNPVIASVTMANQGLYSLKVQDNVSGCTSLTASVQVNINTAPTAPTASNSGATCEGGSAILSATTIPGATYEWTGPNGFSGSQQVITLNQVTLAQAGTYSVRAFVNGCWSSATTTDLVVNEKPIVSIPDVKPVCEGGNLEIIATTNSANPVYDWRGPNNYVGQNATVTIQDVKESKHQGAYTLQVTDGTTGCKSDVVATWVVINEKPNNIMAINNSPKCEGGSVQLNASNIIGATYTWTGPDGFASQDRSPIITDLNANKVGTYTLTVTLGDCLSETVTTTVEMNDKPVANAGDDITTQTNVPVKLNGSGGIIYAWSPANMLSFSNIPNPTFIAGSVGVYEMELTVTNEFGCSDADTVVVNVEKATTNLDSVVIPDLITPNGDGINDVWRLDFLKDINMSYEIAVYARGGSKIMISTNYNNDWTGTYKGKELPDGVYWYAIVLENGAVYKGSLTIKR